MTMLTMPAAGDISQVLGLIELVRLAADADKSKAVLEAIRGERQALDAALTEIQATERRYELALQAANERIAEASRADAVAADIISQANAIRIEAQAEREEAAAYVTAARDKANQVVAMERAAEAAHGAAGRTLEAAKVKAAAIVAEAQETLAKAQEELVAAERVRAEVETKRAQLLAIAGA